MIGNAEPRLGMLIGAEIDAIVDQATLIQTSGVQASPALQLASD